MENGLPAPTMRLFSGETCVFMPTFVEEFVRAIRQIAPRECRDGIDYLPKFGFRFLDLVERISEGFLRLLAFTLRPFSVLDVSIDPEPFNYRTGLVAHWVSAK